ncbi:MAG: acyl carrier protein [Microthrixaceae bacterium]
MPAETHTHSAPLERDRVTEIVIERLAELLEIPESSVSPTDRLVDDLQADSLVLYQLVEMLTEEFGERTLGSDVEDEDLDGLVTVGDTVDFVMARLG